jgi:cadmium resistance transport/sequestration family protein
MELIVTGILAFAATNIDDLFLLALFFGSKKFTSQQIIIGQFAGIGALIAASIAGSFVGYFIKAEYIGFLGLFPIYLGISQFRAFVKNEASPEDSVGTARSRYAMLAVAMVTIANGADNIGVYIPLFATLTANEKMIIVAVFLFMTSIWCIVSRYLATRPALETLIGQYGHAIMPFVLVLLGIFILYESNSFELIASLFEPSCKLIE